MSLTLLGRGYQVAWGMGDAEWPLLHAKRHLFGFHMTWTRFLAYDTRNQPIVASVCILVSAPCTVDSILHGGTIEVPPEQHTGGFCR